MRAEPLVEHTLLHLADDRLVAGRGADLRDAGAHQAAAEHSDGLNSVIVLIHSHRTDRQPGGRR